MIRGISGVIINYTICTLTKSPLNYTDRSSFKMLVIRALILSVCSMFVAGSQFILPLEIVHTITSGSVLFVFIVDYLLNEVKTNLKQALGITIGMIGMVLGSNFKLITLWIDPNYKYETNYQHYVTDNVVVIGVFTACFIGMNVAWAYAMVISKNLRLNPFQINYVQGVAYLFTGTFLYQFFTPKH
jgi:drug/metabolite transporter (DMT)-like permease